MTKVTTFYSTTYWIQITCRGVLGTESYCL